MDKNVNFYENLLLFKALKALKNTNGENEHQILSKTKQIHAKFNILIFNFFL